MREYALFIGTGVGHDGQPVAQYEATVESLMNQAAEWFGGATLEHADGTYREPNATIDAEKALVIRIVTDNREGVLAFASLAQHALDQAAVLVRSTEVQEELVQ